MSRSGLNAASRPFYNTRPVRRVVIGLWAFGAALMIANTWLYWRAWTGQNDRQDELVELEARIAERTAREKAVEAAITGLDIDFLNAQVNYLNGRLAERTFGWSELFDRLSEVLPNDVRLHQLVPRFTAEDEDELEFVFTGDRINLQLSGGAKSGEAILEFVDALFEHPSFKRPSLQTEAKTDGGEINWTLSAVYLPLVEVATADTADTAAHGATEGAVPAAEVAGAGRADAGNAGENS